MLFLQAASVVQLQTRHRPGFSFGDWLARASSRMHRNRLVIALTNKLARIAWSVPKRGMPSDATTDVVMASV